ncbi:MAG TPA: hypothetical protein EYN79_06860 [Planctomycetes bacterium]|nr:hypothetical protein [Planctomycetota bacterium]
MKTMLILAIIVLSTLLTITGIPGWGSSGGLVGTPLYWHVILAGPFPLLLLAVSFKVKNATTTRGMIALLVGWLSVTAILVPMVVAVPAAEIPGWALIHGALGLAFVGLLALSARGLRKS